MHPLNRLHVQNIRIINQFCTTVVKIKTIFFLFAEFFVLFLNRRRRLEPTNVANDQFQWNSDVGVQ